MVIAYDMRPRLLTPPEPSHWAFVSLLSNLPSLSSLEGSEQIATQWTLYAPPESTLYLLKFSLFYL